MKKAIIFITALIFTGCSVSSNIMQRNEQYDIYGYDFTEYTEQGFLFTPEVYLESYESIGLVDIVYTPQFSKIETSTDQPIISAPGTTDYREPGSLSVYWRVTDADPDELIRMAYETATEMGADAITRFSIEPTVFINGSLTVRTQKVTGFAIKRN